MSPRVINFLVNYYIDDIILVLIAISKMQSDLITALIVVTILEVSAMFIETRDDKNKESMLINLARVDLVCKDSKIGKAIVYFANSDIKCCLDDSYEAVMSIITRLQNHTLDASYSSYKYCI